MCGLKIKEKSGFKFSNTLDLEQEKEQALISNEDWNRVIGQTNQKVLFEDRVNIDQEVVVAGKVTDGDIISAVSKENEEIEEEV